MEISLLKIVASETQLKRCFSLFFSSIFWVKMILKQISEIIPFLEKSLNATILDYSAAPLTAQGDNFGSTILAINVKIKLNKISDLLSEVCLQIVCVFFILLLFK